MERVEKKLHRLKSNQILRDLCSETNFSVSHFVQPAFVNESIINNEEILGLKDNFVMSIEGSIKQIDSDIAKGVRNFLLFISPQKKSSKSFNLGFHQKVISSIKEEFKDDIKSFFKLIYEVVFGQENGPRLGSFIKIYTKDKTVELFNSKLNV